MNASRTFFSRMAVLAASAGLAITMAAAPASAQIDTSGLPEPVAGSVATMEAGSADIDEMADQALEQARAGAARTERDARLAAVRTLESAGIPVPPWLPPAPTEQRRTTPTPPADPTPQSPCPRSAAVCVDLDGNRTWLQSGGRLSYGPVPMSHGRPGQITPRGSFKVTRKVRHEVSRIFNNAPMPYAVYFTNNGHAFHQGDIGSQSAGCVRLNEADAATYFDRLQIGDDVYIY